MAMGQERKSSSVDHLAHERRKAEFDVQAMKAVWAGGPAQLQCSQRIAQLVANDPVFRKDDRVEVGRPELFKTTLKKAAHVWNLIQNLQLTEEEAVLLRHFIDEPTYMELHWAIFIPAIKAQATEAQQAKWLPLALNQKILGCYAQTELGHGSNVPGLETTATFDASTDEFVMHTPTLTATKFWPGGLGQVSTHAIVYAHLLINGRDYGIHAFIVQVRSLEDHHPLPGVTVGDIGLKFGNGAYNTVDNGFLSFDHVRIPRENMFMRLATVTKEGKYLKSNVPRQLGYGATMVHVRKGTMLDASNHLSRAVTIAVRYSAVRRQFWSDKGQPETQVLDYMTQQHRLFPLLATAFAFRFAGWWMGEFYSDKMNQQESGDFSILPEMHACTAGLKSLTTSVTADGIEDCRKLCGGHGYLCSSGLPELFAKYVSTCTYEGENVILMLQVARFLVKTISQVKKGGSPYGTAAYLGNLRQLTIENCKVTKGADWLEPRTLQWAFEARSARLAVSCATQIANAVNEEAGFAELSAELVAAARAHCELIVVTKFIEAVKGEFPGRGVKRQLQILCKIYGLSLLCASAGDFLLTGCVSGEQITLAKEQLRALYHEVRPNVVALVDAFNHTDHFLGSTLGRYDGDVYTSLYKEALRCPLNASPVTEGYEKYIRPMLKQQLPPLPASRL